MTIRIEPRNIWVGLHWDSGPIQTRFDVCLIPCVVIGFYRLNKSARQEREAALAADDELLPRRLDTWDQNWRRNA